MLQKQRKASQVWVGTFSNAEQFYNFIAERKDYYEKYEDIDDYPLSDFIETQGESWFDHDFCEGAFSDEILKSAPNLKISYSNLWGPEIDRRLKDEGIESFNAALSLGLFDPNKANDRPEVKNPVSVKGKGFTFHYMGIVEFDC